jgi:DNA-binding transcriptional MocR family regulator
VLAVFLQTEGYERHLRRLRQALKTQAALLAMAVNRHFPAGTRLSTPRGGRTRWVAYDALASGLDVFDFARRSGIANLPGTICSTTDHYRRCIRLSFGFPWSDALETAVRRLGEFITADRPV